MKINRDLILGDIVNRYGGKSYSSAKVALAYDCVFYAEEWLNRPTGVPINGRSKRQARKD